MEGLHQRHGLLPEFFPPLLVLLLRHRLVVIQPLSELVNVLVQVRDVIGPVWESSLDVGQGVTERVSVRHEVVLHLDTVGFNYKETKSVIAIRHDHRDK